MVQKKVYIDLTSFLNTDFLSGIQRVVREVVVRLLKMPELDIILFTWLSTDEKLSILSNDDFLKCYDESTIKKSDIRIIKKISIKSLEKGSILFDIDSTWDGRCHRRYDVIPYLSGRGVLISPYIYDVLPITNPEFWPWSIPLFYDYMAVNLRHADCLVTSVNETVKKLDRIAKKSKVLLSPCTVSWLGSDFRADKDSGEISEKVKEAASKGKYILCVGTIERRKNHKIVLDAYDKKLNSLGINLIFAGRRAEGVDEILARIDSHPQKDKNFYFFEGENDASIDYLYKNAWIVVFPTFDEGFGLPLVEALLHGAVSVASDIPVLREVGGDSCEYFDSTSCDSLIKIIEDCLGTPAVYEACKKRLADYKPVLWDEVVEKIKDMLVNIKKDEERETKMKDISVEQIMQEIRKELSEKGYDLTDIKFSDIKIKQRDMFNRYCLEENLLDANINYRVDLNASVSGNFIKRIIKKSIQKLVRPSFYTNMKKQENFNLNVLQSLNQFEKYTRELEVKVMELEKKVGEKK